MSTTDRAIQARITRNGLRAVFDAQRTGLQLKLSHMAIGTGLNVGYVPTGSETALKSEFKRVGIGGGEYLGDFEILVQALFDGAGQGWVHEIGVFDEDGVLFAIWSEVNNPIAYRTANVPLILALTLAMSEVPPNSVIIAAGGASVNISIAGPWAQLANEVLRLQLRSVTNDCERFTPIIQKTFY